MTNTLTNTLKICNKCGHPQTEDKIARHYKTPGTCLCVACNRDRVAAYRDVVTAAQPKVEVQTVQAAPNAANLAHLAQAEAMLAKVQRRLRLPAMFRQLETAQERLNRVTADIETVKMHPAYIGAQAAVEWARTLVAGADAVDDVEQDLSRASAAPAPYVTELAQVPAPGAVAAAPAPAPTLAASAQAAYSPAQAPAAAPYSPALPAEPIQAQPFEDLPAAVEAHKLDTLKDVDLSSTFTPEWEEQQRRLSQPDSLDGL